MKELNMETIQNQGDGVYLVTITETLTRTVKVNASNSDEAERKVERAYDKADIVLVAEDCDDVEFFARKHTDEDLSLYEEI